MRVEAKTRHDRQEAWRQACLRRQAKGYWREKTRAISLTSTCASYRRRAAASSRPTTLKLWWSRGAAGRCGRCGPGASTRQAAARARCWIKIEALAGTSEARSKRCWRDDRRSQRGDMPRLAPGGRSLEPLIAMGRQPSRSSLAWRALGRRTGTRRMIRETDRRPWPTVEAARRPQALCFARAAAEPAFGIIKSALGADQCFMRGLDKVASSASGCHP